MIHSVVKRALSLAVIALIASVPYAAAQECYTPLEWIPKNYVSNFDRNKNFVDDAIEKMKPDERVDIILCLNSCGDNEDFARFQKMGMGEPSFRSAYLSLMTFRNVRVETALALGSDERVAMVEMARPIVPEIHTSQAAAKITTSATYAGANLEDMYPGIDGTGINIAIIDSGVDNGPADGSPGGHESLPGWKFKHGYDAVFRTETDPDDDDEHGTGVASIALGIAKSDGTFRGVAPQAGLIDIKVWSGAFSIDYWESMYFGIEKVIQKKHDWNIHVANMSFGYRNDGNSNGTDGLSQMANRMVREGIVVVGVMGNRRSSGDPLHEINGPGAGDLVLTVAAANDLGDVDRTNDIINSASRRGPRLSDGDAITVDEDKPEVTAYGTNIYAAESNTTNGYLSVSGTSLAAPQVAGLAALILQAKPNMDPLSVGELIQLTAEDKGTAGWDDTFGHGIIDAYHAIDTLLGSVQTDVQFDEYCNQPGNPDWWTSASLEPVDPVIVEGTANNIKVKVHNSGTSTAYNVKVRVGIYNFSNSNAEYDIALENIPQINAGDTYEFTVPWTPQAEFDTPPVVHACLKAFIIYPNDTNHGNNCAQHNVNIKQSNSPAPFPMTVVNPTGKNLNMEIVTDPTAAQIAAQGWELTITEKDFVMRANECPKTVVVSLEPMAPNAPDTMAVNVYVRGREGQSEYQELGGVRIIAIDGRGKARPPVHAVFDGIAHTGLGYVHLRSTPTRLAVSHIDGGGDDGIMAWLGRADFWRGTLEEFLPDDLLDGQSISFTAQGSVGGTAPVTIATLRIEDESDHARLSVAFQHTTTTTLTVEVYNDGVLMGVDSIVLTTATASVTFANAWPPLKGIRVTPYRQADGDVYAEVSFADKTDIEILSSTAATMVAGDRIVVRAGTQATLADYIENVEILADGPTEFALTGEAGGVFERPFRAMGNPVLEWKDDGQTLTARAFTDRSAVGVRAEVPELKGYDLTWTATDISDVPYGTHLAVSAHGNFISGPGETGSVWLQRTTSDADIFADLSRLGVQDYRVEVYNNGNFVYGTGGLTSFIGRVNNWPNGGGHAVDDNTDDPSFRLLWPGAVSFSLANGASVGGDELRITDNGNRMDDLLSVTEVGAYVIGLNELNIISEEATSLLPVSSVGYKPVADLPFRLYQNYPNPFDQRTMFKFDLFAESRVELEIYNLAGERIASVLARNLAEGTHEVEWKRGGVSVPAGAYIYRLKAVLVRTGQTFELQRKMIILD